MRGFMKYFAFITFVSCSLSFCFSQAVQDTLERPAKQIGDTAARSVLLGICKAGDRLVAVGERGIIVLSDDGGRTWHQARVPVSETLTAVEFPSNQRGWAVGHSGVILHSEDGGETWTKQFDGKTAAQLALQQAQSILSTSGASGGKYEAATKMVSNAERLVKEGPDKPFLALHFENESSGLVVGAYGLIFHTQDAGKTWLPWMSRLDNPGARHLYAVEGSGKNIYLAGEQGLFFRSGDGGVTFSRVNMPYSGTYFSLLVGPAREIVTTGMRGNAYLSADEGKTFVKVVNPIPVNFSASTILKNGVMIFANQAGQLFESRDQGKSMHLLDVPPLPPITAMIEVDHALVTVGVAGVIPVSLGGAGSAVVAGGVQ